MSLPSPLGEVSSGDEGFRGGSGDSAEIGVGEVGVGRD